VAVTATPPGERHALPAMMAAVCLREDHWQVHHLAADLPTAELIGLADDVGAGLVVLSTATTAGARAAARAAREVRQALPGARVLGGHQGDTLSRLRDLARSSEQPEGAAISATETISKIKHG
jgi:cobalamin-dependent methionine synthase I